MKMICASMSVFFYAVSLLTAVEEDTTNHSRILIPLKSSKNQSQDIAVGHDDNTASGRMGGGRSGAGGGGSHFHGAGGGGGRGTIPSRPYGSGSYNPYPYNPQQPQYTIESEEPEEEQTEESTEIHDLPGFTLLNHTPSVNLGETIQINISDLTAEPPITVWWHYDGDPEWIQGGNEFTHTSDEPGLIEISVVIQDNNGLFSQPQTTNVNVFSPQIAPEKKGPGNATTPQQGIYYETMPTTPVNQTEKESQPPEKPKEGTKAPVRRNKPTPEGKPEENLMQFLDVDSTEQRNRLQAKLTEDLAALKTMEKALQNELDFRNQLAAKLDAVIQKGKETNTPTFFEEQRIASEIESENYYIDVTQGQIDYLIKDIAKLNSLLK